MDTYRQHIQLPQTGPALFAWPPGEPQARPDAKRKLEPDANEVVERLNGFVLSPNSLKKLRTGEAVDVSTAPTLMGSSLPQQGFDGAALEIEVDPGQSGDDAQQRPLMVQLPSPSSPDGSPPRGTQNAIIPYPNGLIFPGSTGFQPPAAPFGGNSDLMQALDLKGRGGAEASAALDIPRRLVRNNSCSSIPRSLFFNFSGGESTAAEMDEDLDDDPNSKAVIPWAPPPFVLQGILGASRSRPDQPIEEEMEDVGGVS